jgi:hypothetical protein
MWTVTRFLISDLFAFTVFFRYAATMFVIRKQSTEYEASICRRTVRN